MNKILISNNQKIIYIYYISTIFLGGLKDRILEPFRKARGSEISEIFDRGRYLKIAEIFGRAAFLSG